MLYVKMRDGLRKSLALSLSLIFLAPTLVPGAAAAAPRAQDTRHGGTTRFVERPWSGEHRAIGRPDDGRHRFSERRIAPPSHGIGGRGRQDLRGRHDWRGDDWFRGRHDFRPGVPDRWAPWRTPWRRPDLHTWHRGHWNHGWYGGRYGWWWVVGGLWYLFAAPVYPYPDPWAPTIVLADPAPVPDTTQYWYYCQSAQAYYPYVAACPEGWQRVPATPPGSR